jgi:phospholipase C
LGELEQRCRKLEPPIYVSQSDPTHVVSNGRCGPGTRTPFILISPWAKTNFVDHTMITQASVVKFIEDNWLGGQRLGGGSFDATAGSITNMLNTTGNNPTVFLDQTFGTKLAAAPTN